ncbi:MAG: Kelch repeat-containing protein [Planctomycetota bacterium]|jgi:N-acetylneuraminic acid mutarotase
MFGKRVSWLAAACLAAAVLAGGCGDDDVVGGDGGGVKAEPAGYWVCHEERASGEAGWALMCLEETGGVISGMVMPYGVTGTVSGSTVDLTMGDPVNGSGAIASATALDADTMVGLVELYDTNVLLDTGTVTMTRFVPSGQFAASGTFGGAALNVDTATCGCGYVEDTGDIQIGYMVADASVFLLFAPDALSAGSFTVVFDPPGAGQIRARLRNATPAGYIGSMAESGTLDVSKCDETGAAGTFTLVFSGGAETVTGSFDVPWNVGEYCRNGWVTKAPMPAGTRHALTAASLGGKMYAMGGSDLFTPCEEYDPVSNTWTSMDNVPFQCREAVAVSDGTYIYLTGGYDNTLGTSVATLYRFDPSAAAGSQWTALAPMNQARGFHAAAVLGGKIYVFGGNYNDGSTDTPLASVEAYDVSGGTWDATVTDLPQTLILHTATTVGTKIYITGGATSFAGSLVNTVYEFDPAGNGGLGSYTAMAPMPTARCVHAAAEAGGLIYVTGGATNTAPNASASVEVYDPATDSWAMARDLPDTRRLHGSCAVGTVVYVVGGENEAGGGQNYGTNFALDTQ